MLIKKDGVKRKGRKIKWSWKKVEPKLELGSSKKEKWTQSSTNITWHTHRISLAAHVEVATVEISDAKKLNPRTDLQAACYTGN